MKLLFHPGFAGQVARIFDTYAEMREYVEGYLRHVCAQSSDWRSAAGYNLNHQIEARLKETVAVPKGDRLGYCSVELRFVGEPRVKIADEKPLVMRDDDHSFNRGEFWYSAEQQVEVRLSYTLDEGEKKVPGEPYQPPKSTKHVTEAYSVHYTGEYADVRFNLKGEGAPWYCTRCNGRVYMVKEDYR